MRTIALLLPLLLLACATTGEPGVPDYATSAQENFQSGMEAFEDENWLEASQYFEHVRTKYPYSQFAALSELRLADTQFGQGRWTEAIDAYRNFIRFRPSHPEVDWAAFRIGESHYQAIPSDFFIFPPSTEKDQTQVKAARDAFRSFVQTHPQSKYLGQARERLAELTQRLAEHEDAVARFYAKRDEWAAVALRYQYLLQNYPQSPLVTRAAESIADAYRRLGEPGKARAPIESFLAAHPDHAQAAALEAVLREL